MSASTSCINTARANFLEQQSKSFYIDNLNKRAEKPTMKQDNHYEQQDHFGAGPYLSFPGVLDFTAYPQPHTSGVIHMELEDDELWTRFSELTNEMILTKAGR